MDMSAQSDMSITVMIHTVKWQPTTRGNLKMQNLQSLRKGRHTRKGTTSISKRVNTGTKT